MRIMIPSEQKSGGVNIETALVDVIFGNWTERTELSRHEYYIDLTQAFQNIGDNDIVVATLSYDSSILDPNGWANYKALAPYIIIDDTRKREKNFVLLAVDSSLLSNISPSTYPLTVRLLLFRQS